jgi:hypothetical protein
MLCPNFQTQFLPYRLRGDSEIIPNVLAAAMYNLDIPEPYGEQIGGAGLMGMFFDPNDNGRIVLTSWMRRVYWPGWGVKSWAFSADTGAFIAHENFIGGYYAQEVFQGAGGELYLRNSTGQHYPLEPGSYRVMTEDVILPSRFGVSLLNALFIDRFRDLVMFRANSETTYQLRRFSTGELIHTYRFQDRVEAACYAEDTSAYLLLRNKTLVGIDYATGFVFQSTRIPQINDVQTTRIAYDRRYRRLLVASRTPDAEDGSSTVQIIGYRNVPIATHVCRPIPLSRVREGRTVRVLHKLVGDLGEGLTGSVRVSSEGSNLEVIQNEVGIDGDGDGVGEIIGSNEGVETLNVSTEVQCLL